MSNPQKYVIVCAPSGTGLREAVEKLQFHIGTDIVALEDIEATLCDDAETESALKHAGFTCPPGRPNWPRMYDITWNLSRSQIADLWASATRKALHKLERSPNTFKLLSCHLTYYSGRRDEFYSPINSTSLHQHNLIPSHILLLIDDIYDMYIRLCHNNALFDPCVCLPEYFGRIKDEEGCDPKSLAHDQLAHLCLEWETGIMNHLLSWRNLEIVLAENLARQYNAHLLVWGVKQYSKCVAHWLKESAPTTIYLSHPISRPRRIFRDSGKWHDIVSQFNKLQMKLLPHGLICIMPTAIDEYRQKRKRRKNKLATRLPLLEARWPVPEHKEVKDILYCFPEGTTNLNHEELLWFKFFHGRQWSKLIENPSVLFNSGDKYKDLINNADKVLRSLERQIEIQISSRDHLFVSWANGILVYRPFFNDGVWSSGVKAEIAHWRLLARTDQTKKMALVHFDEDVVKMVSYYNEDSQRRHDREQEIGDEVIAVLNKEHGVDNKQAKLVINFIEQGKPNTMLDKAPIPPYNVDEIGEKLPSYKRRCEKLWLLNKLTGAGLGIEVPENQIAVWCIKNKNEIENIYEGIAHFLKNGLNPTTDWVESFNVR